MEMDHTSSNQISLGMNNVKYQNSPQNGAVLLAKLQQKVARLEIALRDKETELLKIHSSSKVSYVNELKIQTEVYFQEVLRLKNQLNLLQEHKLPYRESSQDDPGNRRPTKKQTSVDTEIGSQGKSMDKNLIKSVEKLQEENERLSAKLVAIQAEKERLASNYEKLIENARENEVACTEGTTQTSPRIENQSAKSPEMMDESLHLLKIQIEELQKKEKSWEEERETYKELVLSLKEDRVFFKDTSQQRNDELWNLQKELMKLQKKIGGFQLNGKPPCKQCTKPSYKTAKSTKKASTKDTSTAMTPLQSVSSEGSSSSSSMKPPKPKNSSVASSKRLPTSKKTFSSKEGPPSPSVSKSPSSSTSTSRSSSNQASPSHSDKRASSISRLKDPSGRMSMSFEKSNSGKSMSGSLSSEEKSSTPSSPLKKIPVFSGQNTPAKKPLSPSNSLPSPKQNNTVVHSSRSVSSSSQSSPSKSIPTPAQSPTKHSSSSLSSPSKPVVKRSSSSTPSKTASSPKKPPLSPKVSSNSSPSKNTFSPVKPKPTKGTPFSPTKRHVTSPKASPLSSPQKENVKLPRQPLENQTRSFEMFTDRLEDDLELNKEVDEEIALELMRGSEMNVSTDGESNANNTSKIETENHSESRSLEDLDSECRSPDFAEKGQDLKGSLQTNDGNESAELFLSLLEGHFTRKKKAAELKNQLQKHKGSPSGNSGSKSPVKTSPSKSKLASKSSAVGRSPSKKTHKSVQSTPKKTPKKVLPPTSAAEDGEEPQNMKDIDKMVCLLESHIARKALLSLLEGK